ncbi:hypothetical protein [Streptomyces sp. NPDC059979]|uniref:hypothetical protein n=1 Tax=Streptomyces sp. NPDC059979 TaxID=3347021 RepID=UPI0036AAC50A
MIMFVPAFEAGREEQPERLLPMASSSEPATSGPVACCRQPLAAGPHDNKPAAFESDSITGGQEERARQLEGVAVVGLEVLHQYQP